MQECREPCFLRICAEPFGKFDRSLHNICSVIHAMSTDFFFQPLVHRKQFPRRITSVHINIMLFFCRNQTGDRLRFVNSVSDFGRGKGRDLIQKGHIRVNACLQFCCRLLFTAALTFTNDADKRCELCDLFRLSPRVKRQ